MNQFAGDARPIGGGAYQALIRLPRDGKPGPIKAKGGQPAVYSSEADALRAVVKHLCAYVNGDFRRDGDTLTTARAEREKVFGRAGR